MDPFAVPKQGVGAVGGAIPAAGFSPLSAGLQQQNPAPATGWVSFEDDSSGGGGAFGFTAALQPAFPAAPAHSAAAPAPAFHAAFPPPEPTAAPLVPARLPTPGGEHFPRPPPRTAAPPAGVAVQAASSFSPLSSAAAQSTFPTFSSINSAASGTAPSTAVGGTGVAPSTAQRLQRPPTSATHSASPPITAAAAPVFAPGPAPSNTTAPSPTSNPFASSANPHGATAAARSADPFADLGLKPVLPRPPPMAAQRHPSPGAAVVHQPVASTFAVPTPAAAAPPPAPASVFPSFAALHQQQRPQQQQQPHPRGSVAASSGATHPFPTFTATAAAARLPDQTGSDGLGTALGNVVETASFDAFGGTLLAASRPAPSAMGLSPLRQHPAQATASLYPTRSPPPPPPPPYFDALEMSSASAARPPPPPYEEAVAMSPLPASSPPPMYTEALAMPDAFGAPALAAAPPPYELASIMPQAPVSVLIAPSPEAEAAVAAEPSPFLDLALSSSSPGSRGMGVTGTSRYLPTPSANASGVMTPPSNADNSPHWATFNDVFGHASTFAGHVAAAPSAPAAAAGVRVSPFSGLNVHASPPPASSFGSASSGLPPPPQPQPSMAPPPLPGQICIEVRLPPLKPKEAVLPIRLAAGMGLAFAAPGGDGISALQWCLRPDHPPTSAAPQHGGGAHGPAFELAAGASAPHGAEDLDSAPAAALAMPRSCEAGVTCMLVDAVSGSLWTGHKDGKVARWSVSPGRVAQYEHHWKAHAFGKVTCMALTTWGELWTGASSGSVRAWQYLGAIPASRPPARMFECRRARLTQGAYLRSSAPRAHSKIRLLAVGPSGRVVWSAGRSGMALWGAYDGEYLGSLTPGADKEAGAISGRMGAGATGGGRAGATGAYAGETGAVGRDGLQQQQLELNPQTGLESGLIYRPFVARAPPEGGDEGEGGGEPDLGQQVFKGLAGAAKFAAKLGKRIKKNVVGDGQSSSTPNEGGGASDQLGGGNASGAGGSANNVVGRGKLVALVPGLDGSMFVAYKNGVVEKYTEWGRLLWGRDYGRDMRLHCAALVGSHLWLGCADGHIRTASSVAGELGRSWKAFDFPVAALAHDPHPVLGLGLVYSLSEHGCLRAWPGSLPDEAALVAWRDGLLPCLSRHQLCVLAGTWNVNETRPALSSLRAWLVPRAASAHIVAIALQEVEMGTSSVAMDAAKNLLYKTMLERGNQNAQWWATELGSALSAAGCSWSRVALRQMSGMLVVVYCRSDLQQHVGEVATANVPCGVMGVGGNKGAVAVSMTVYRRRLMFVGSHFAAHQEKVDERNDNYTKIVRQLHFHNTSKAAARMRADHQPPSSGFSNDGSSARDGNAYGLGPGGGVAGGGFGFGSGATPPDSDIDAAAAAIVNSSAALTGPDAAAAAAAIAAAEDDGHGPGLADAAMLVWAGDFNYRINGSYHDVSVRAAAGDFGHLFIHDQCRLEMEKGTVFRGLREPLPLGYPPFVPTYKFDKGEPAGVGEDGRMVLPYDTSEKQRVPAWTDRIFYRGSRHGSLDVAAEEVQVSIARPQDYNCCLELNDSDHKPVYAVLQVQLPAYKQDQKRQHSLAAAAAVARATLSSAAHVRSESQSARAPPPPPPVQASTPTLQVRAGVGAAFVDLVNTSSASLLVQIAADRPVAGVPGARAGMVPGPLPAWLEVSPSTFALGPADGSAVAWGGGGEVGQGGRARVFVRALPEAGQGGRAPDPVRLHFSLRPIWGAAQTLGGAPEPVVTISLDK